MPGSSITMRRMHQADALFSKRWLSFFVHLVNHVKWEVYHRRDIDCGNIRYSWYNNNNNTYHYYNTTTTKCFISISNRSISVTADIGRSAFV